MTLSLGEQIGSLPKKGHTQHQIALRLIQLEDGNGRQTLGATQKIANQFAGLAYGVPEMLSTKINAIPANELVTKLAQQGVEFGPRRINSYKKIFRSFFE